MTVNTERNENILLPSGLTARRPLNTHLPTGNAKEHPRDPGTNLAQEWILRPKRTCSLYPWLYLGPESASRKILAVEAKSTNPGPHGMENLLAGVSEAQMPPNILNLGTISRKVNRIKQLGLMQARLWIKMTWTISLKSPLS